MVAKKLVQALMVLLAHYYNFMQHCREKNYSYSYCMSLLLLLMNMMQKVIMKKNIPDSIIMQQ